MYKPESMLENEIHKLLLDFKIQTEHLISARWSDLIIINNKKENLQNCGLCRVKLKEREKKDKYLDFAWDF